MDQTEENVTYSEAPPDTNPSKPKFTSTQLRKMIVPQLRIHLGELGLETEGKNRSPVGKVKISPLSSGTKPSPRW